MSTRILELTCPGCARTMKQAEAVVVQRLRQGKPLRCLVCAKELTVPDDVKAKGGEVVKEPVRRLGRCPSCLRPAQSQGVPPLVRGVCQACRVGFLCEQPGHGSFDVPVTSRAEPEEVEQAITQLPVRPTSALMGLALRKRCERGALSAGEATVLTQMSLGLARWRAASVVPFLPWPQAEVQPLLGPFIFHSTNVHSDPSTGITTLTNELMLDQPGGMQLSPGASVALNTLGIGLLLATGSGFTVSGGRSPPPEILSQQFLVRLKAMQDGTVLEVATSQGGAHPQLLDPTEQVALAQRLFGLRATLDRYVRALALCAEDLRGLASKGLVVEAARLRLLDVGASASDAMKYAPEFVVS